MYCTVRTESVCPLVQLVRNSLPRGMSFTATKDNLKSFVTESEIEERKKVRQLEWEKARKPDQPLQCPDEPIDNRTLYDRLKDQKVKEQEEKDEAKKMKNFVRGLEHDEVEFLDQLDDIYTKMEREKRADELKELKEFKERVAAMQAVPPELGNLTESSSLKRKECVAFSSQEEPRKRTQKDLLANVVRTKRLAPDVDIKPLISDSQLHLTTPSAPLIMEKRAAALVASYDSASDSD